MKDKYEGKYTRAEIENSVQFIEKLVNYHYGDYSDKPINPNIVLPMRIMNALANHLGTFEGNQISEDVLIIIDGYKQLVHNGFFKETAQ